MIHLSPTSYRLRPKKGYTLIEMIIAVSIVGIMTAIVVGTYSFGKNSDQLQGEGLRLTSVLRNIRLRDFNGVTNQYTGTSAQYPSGGYGIYAVHDAALPKDYYILFADQTAETGAPHFVYDPTKTGGCTASNPAVACDPSVNTCGAGKFCYTEFIQKFDLPDNIRFTGFQKLEIVFKNNTVGVWENNGTWGAAWVPSGNPVNYNYTLTLQHKNGCPTIGKKAQITLDTSLEKISDLLLAC